MAVSLNPQDRRKLDELRRIKFLATTVLVVCFFTLIITKLLAANYPSLAIIAAFAEAATIGGLADWYAVVALFKRPMGLPIPHTAIIPRNQDRIADNLGAFIEENFLAAGPVRQKLQEVDFADEMIKWLSDRGRSASLASFVAKLAPQMLHAVEETGLKGFASERVATQLKQTDMSPVVMEVLSGLTKDGRHQQLMDELVDALHRFLSNEDAIEAIRKRVAEEMPSALIIFRADEAILRRILKTAGALLEELKANKGHELRDEFESFFKKYVRRLKRSKTFAKRIDTMKSQLLERPEVTGMADQLWATLVEFVETDVAADDSILIERLTDLLVDVAQNLKGEDQLRSDINAGMATAVSTFVDAQKHNLSKFVAEQVKSWDFNQMTLLIEAIDLVQTSCGTGVPVMRFEKERVAEELAPFYADMGPEGVKEYWGRKNVETIDGAPTGIFHVES